MSTASATDFLTEYAEGWAQLLAARVDAAQHFTWSPAGAYTTGQTGIFIAAVPTSPDRIVTLTPMPFDAHPTLTDARVDLQIRFRAGPDIREVWGMRAATRKVLASLFPALLPTGVYVSSLVFAYGGAMGQDDAKRWQWADMYRTRAAEPR